MRDTEHRPRDNVDRASHREQHSRGAANTSAGLQRPSIPQWQRFSTRASNFGAQDLLRHPAGSDSVDCGGSQGVTPQTTQRLTTQAQMIPKFMPMGTGSVEK
jgi:hypothetical protein